MAKEVIIRGKDGSTHSIRSSDTMDHVRTILTYVQIKIARAKAKKRAENIGLSEVDFIIEGLLYPTVLKMKEEDFI